MVINFRKNINMPNKKMPKNEGIVNDDDNNLNNGNKTK